ALRHARARARPARAVGDVSAPAHAHGLGVDDLGEGEPALLLLTGWCSSRERWAKAAPLLAEHRRVVSFEWRGHGRSRPAAADFGTAEMVQDALSVIEAAGLRTVIPCSASHSGWVAIELRRRLGDRVPAIVHLDWMVQEPSNAYMDLLSELQDPDRWPHARDTLFDIWRAGEESKAIAAAIDVMRRQNAEMWMRSGREIEASYRRAGSPLRALSAFPSVPAVRHLYGQPTTPEYLDSQLRFADEHDWYSVCRLDARTHFSMIEAPGEVASEIERVAATLGPA
ncbi:MAG: alpha/beta fold hydrolase, partial [Solirubrobacteraceae bacterium]